MSSCKMNTQDSDEEVDLEALRLAALKSRKAKFGPSVNHNNLIPIVPVPIVTAFDDTKIKKEKLSPPPESSTKESKLNDGNKENEEDKVSESNYSESTLDNNDQDILSVEDKEEEDSLERLMDQLEAEISGKVPVETKKSVLMSKNNKKDRRKKKEKVKVGDDEVELIQVKEGKEPGAIIEIRESASPVNKNSGLKSESFSQGKSPIRRSRSPFRSRSRSPFYGSRGYGRSRSPYWSRSPRRSRSPYRRSRSPYWLSRRSRSLSRMSRSPFGRYRSPLRKRSPYSRFSKSRSKSFDRRRSPWSSPRRRSKSPFYREWSPSLRRRNYSSPSGRGRRSFSPRGGSKSPRGRSRSPRRFPRNSPMRRSKSPFIRSKSPLKRNKSPPRRPPSPYLRRSKSPFNYSPGKRMFRRSRTPPRWSASPGRRPKSPNRLSPRIRSKSPPKKSDQFRKSPRRRSLSFSPSPTSRRNRSPLKVVEKNKLDVNEKDDKLKDRSRADKRQGSLSRENNRRAFRQRPFRRFSPTRNRKSTERQVKRSKSPKPNSERKGEESSNQNTKSGKTSPAPLAPLDPVLEARKKKFEVLSEVDPTVDKKISLKSIKESTENVEEDEDALTINLEGNLWDESEESGDEFESRFKSSEAGKNRTVVTNRTVLSFRNLRDSDSANRQDLINKPLIEENRREKGRRDRSDRWQERKGGRNESRKPGHLNARKEKTDDSDKSKLQSSDKSESGVRSERRSERKPIVWSKRDESKHDKSSREPEVSKVDRNKTVDKRSGGSKDRLTKENTNVHETDDFDKLISDFEKELESDICLIPKDVSPPPPPEKTESKRPKISVKQDLFECKANTEVTVKKPAPARVVKISEATSINTDFDLEETNKVVRNIEKIDLKEPDQDGPEDYIEDDDFALDVSTKPTKNKMDEEDNQSDLRAVLSRRRNQRITKVVNLQENVSTRLLQSAFQGLGNKKSRRQKRDVQEPVDLAFDKTVKNTGVERRRVLLLQRDNTPISTSKIAVPEVKPDTTIYQRFPPTSERRKRKLRRQQDPIEDLMVMDQEDDDDGGFEIEEGKQSRRFRLKRNVTLSSQIDGIC